MADPPQNLLRAGTEEYPVVVAQYKRWHLGAGSEQELHWAIMVVTNENNLEGRTYQASNRFIFPPNEPSVEIWEISTRRDASLERTFKSLGGVRIGTVKHQDLEALDAAILAHTPVNTGKPAGWNCRNWVIECVEIMKGRGWVYGDINRQEDLLPAMKRATAATASKGRPTVVNFN